MLHSLIRYINCAVALNDVSSFINIKISSLDIINSSYLLCLHIITSFSHKSYSKYVLLIVLLL